MSIVNDLGRLMLGIIQSLVPLVKDGLELGTRQIGNMGRWMR